MSPASEFDVSVDCEFLGESFSIKDILPDVACGSPSNVDRVVDDLVVDDSLGTWLADVTEPFNFQLPWDEPSVDRASDDATASDDASIEDGRQHKRAQQACEEMRPTRITREQSRARQRVYERRYRQKKRANQQSLMTSWFVLETKLQELLSKSTRRALIVPGSKESSSLQDRMHRVVEELRLLQEDHAMLRIRLAWGHALEIKEVKDLYRHVRIRYDRQFEFTW